MQQSQPNGQITRVEYEARHAALVAQVAQNEARFFAEQAAIKVNLDRKFDRLIDMLDKLVNKDVLKPQIDALDMRIKDLEQEKISRSQLFWMRFGPLISLGMGIITLLEIFTKGRLVP